MNLSVPERAIEVLASGSPTNHGAHLAVNITLWCGDCLRKSVPDRHCGGGSAHRGQTRSVSARRGWSRDRMVVEPRGSHVRWRSDTGWGVEILSSAVHRRHGGSFLFLHVLDFHHFVFHEFHVTLASTKFTVPVTLASKMKPSRCSLWIS